ncbi:MmcQ/YjbR family DNA-binding protein [Paenibacillus alkalitolerans]|uniref:MmcQ/YjbR family DNA-binding protein n=1 Tax=Paenibacillus alkalitolerans TaxID=2799335 RepID=UPI0018F7AF09|nr:MmcQ/YjbR family DNA-binding protein [Paenibacillus alkalitolerans]
MEPQFFESFRKMALSLPGVAESVSYGTPSFKLKDKLLARFHEDEASLVLKMDFETRDFLLRVNPETYYITDHYKNYPYVLVRMRNADLKELNGHLQRIWKSHATKKLLQTFEERQGNDGD